MTPLKNICLSGGADGADLQWGMVAGSAGHNVVHWSFKGHKSSAPATEIVILTPELLDEADEPCKRASKTLKRWFPPKSLFVKNLLRRNWFQVKDAERVYAVAAIEKGIVTGGTAWATQMFIDRHDGATCECYVFDQEIAKWFQWVDSQWTEIESPPSPHGVWAGIGSRELNEAGKNAIRTIMSWTKPN